MIGDLAGLQCTKAEIAAILRISRPTFDAFLTREPAAQAAFENGILEGKASLRRTQFRLAERNAAMAIFLGKNLLGQRDIADVRGPGPAGSFPLFDVASLRDVTDDELAIAERVFSRLTGAIDEPACQSDPGDLAVEPLTMERVCKTRHMP